MSLHTGTNRKRPASKQHQDTQEDGGLEDSLCWFCQDNRACVTVQIPHPRFPKRPRVPRSYCLLHYYSTPMARTIPAEHVSILDQEEMDRQLAPMQEMFAEAFVQLQQELTEEAARAFTSQQNDPLAILNDLHQSSSTKQKRLKKPPPPPVSKPANQSSDADGGFLRPIPLPERLLRTQEAQAQRQREMTRRMDRAVAASQETDNYSLDHMKPKDLSKRRKSSRKSIWNVVMDKAPAESAHNSTATSSSKVSLDPFSNRPNNDNDNDDQAVAHISCTCGSNRVHLVGTNTNRNHEVPKAETWGLKDREELLSRLQCQVCGKTWNEEV